MKKHKKDGVIKVFEGFAGYGGASFGLRRAQIEHKVVGYSEFDRFAAQLYDANHLDENGKPIKNWGDITKINAQELPDFDMFTGGFPCQPFSTVGLQKGELDQHGRGVLLYDIIRICAHKKPKYVLLENVKGFATKRFESTFNILKSEFKNLGYGDLHYAILNTKNYGIPQNRERLWIFARLGGLPQNFSIIPPFINNGLRLKDFIDENPPANLYLSQKQIQRIKDFYKIESFKVSEPSCFDLYNRNIRSDGLCITILAPEHNKMRLVEPCGADGLEVVRKFSVDEQFRLMGFKTGELNYANQSYTQLSKRAANGWDINLVEILLKQGKNYKINNTPSIDEILKGIIYCAVPLEKIKSKLGKGGKTITANTSDSPIIIAGVFHNVFVNDIKIENEKLILLITKETSGSHAGRLRLKYGPANTYEHDGHTYSNESLFRQIKRQLGLAEDSCWFVFDITAKNQDEIVLNTIIVNEKGLVEYDDSAAIQKEWSNLIKERQPNYFETQENNDDDDEDLLNRFKKDEQAYKEFKEKYGVQALQAVSGTELLHKIFINETRNKDNLCYALEFDEQYNKFGGIRGGSSFKYGLYYSVDKKSWTTGPSSNPRTLSEEEAIQAGTVIKDEIVESVKIIEECGNFSQIDDYIKLGRQLNEVMQKTNNKIWILKYFHMLFPDVFPPFYSSDWQNAALDIIGEATDENQFVRIGRIALFIKKRGISSLSFFNGIFNQCQDMISSSNFESSATKGQNRVIYGTPGCGKSYYVENKLLKDLDIKDDCVIRTTFYQDYTNTDFVGQILPKVNADETVSYEFNPGPFSIALIKAIENKNLPVALIIEELNRGNAATIFGDIFQLLDRDKLGKSMYCITNVNLQSYLNKYFANEMYTFNSIRIPANLHIFATMNTSDQNVFTLDAAFKRRWHFEKIKNKFDKTHEYKDYYVPGMNDVTWERLVNSINNFIISRIDYISSEDKQLGLYFIDEEMLCKSQQEVNDEKKKRFAYKLFEYLWSDVAKFSHSEWFDPSIKTLDDLIDKYILEGKQVFLDGIID